MRAKRAKYKKINEKRPEKEGKKKKKRRKRGKREKKEKKEIFFVKLRPEQKLPLDVRRAPAAWRLRRRSRPGANLDIESRQNKII